MEANRRRLFAFVTRRTRDSGFGRIRELIPWSLETNPIAWDFLIVCIDLITVVPNWWNELHSKVALELASTFVELDCVSVNNENKLFEIENDSV